jgi:hypothetical protein
MIHTWYLSLIKRWKRWDRNFSLTKRQQFVGATVVLTLILVFTQLVPSEWRYPMVIALAVCTYFISAFTLRDDLQGIEWFTLLALPTLYTASIAVFYFLLPVRWLTRVPVAALYALGMYALLLTENIYNVAAARTIALLRAAYSVGFLLTLTTYFLLVQTILAYRLYPIYNSFFIGLITFPLILQFLWSIDLEAFISVKVGELSGIITLVLFELVWIISFWPVNSTLQALFYTTCLYGLGGLGQQYLADRLYKRTVWEFFSVVSIVFCILLIATNWYNVV